ncbi:hypothetical protein ACQEU8_34445 [Streptomyces sp. CA-250714]|uniref:hypothetical protein n=1 Tax=Streptomyces sp. CA-250714 TaxID=3240060 RepID=UPI003D8F37CD
MTAENNGTGAAPEGGDEDPFAYLYRQEGGDQQSAAPGQQPGVPRRSFNQVRAVGERQYGYGYPQQQQRSGYGYPQQRSGYGYPQQPPPPESRPSPHYAAPETVPGGRAAARQQGAAGGNGRGSRTGLLVGAIAVVAAVVIGIGAAIVFNDDSTDDPQARETGSSQQDEQGQGDDQGDKDKNDKKPVSKSLPKEDAVSLNLDGAIAGKTVPGAEGRGGAYVEMNHPGAAATWEMQDLPAGGKYTLHVRYTVPGKDAEADLTVNGKPESRPLRMKNFSGVKEGDWEHGWQNSWSNILLQKGQNSIRIACDSGCEANLDKVWLTKGWK